MYKFPPPPQKKMVLCLETAISGEYWELTAVDVSAGPWKPHNEQFNNSLRP